MEGFDPNDFVKLGGRTGAVEEKKSDLAMEEKEELAKEEE
jgi:hypothetical protein